MPSSDRQISFPLLVGGRLRSALSILSLAVGLLLFGATAAALGPQVLFGAVLSVLVLLGLLGLVGEEQGRREHRAARGRQTSSVSTPDTVDENDPVEILKQRYAAGELTDDEFDRRVERLVALGDLGEARDEPEAERT